MKGQTIYGQMKRIYTFADKGIHAYKTGKKDWSCEIEIKKTNLDDEWAEYQMLGITIGETTGLKYCYYNKDENGNYAECFNSNKIGLKMPQEMWNIVLKKLQEIHIKKITTSDGE